MKINKLKTTWTVALAAALVTISATAVQAQVCAVPSGPYPTIQSAASDPACTTINVAAGVYNENVVVNFPTTINGAQAGNRFDARVGAESEVNGAAPIGAVPVFSVNAADVTIDGFTIKNTVTGGAATGIAVRGLGNDAAILNNIFDAIFSPDTLANGTAQAIYLTEGGPDNVNIQDNEMKNIHSNRSAKGVLLGDNTLTNPSQNVKIESNSIHDVTSDTRGAYGVSVAVEPNTSGLKILNNAISNLTGGGWVHAIGLEGDTPDAEVNNNDISNLTDLTPSVPADSICVFFESNPSFGTVVVHTNNFYVTAASYGIAVHPALTGGFVDGRCNWWNSPSGPTSPSNPGGTGAQMSPNVSHAPWLIAPAPGGACFGGNLPPTTAECKSGGWMTRVRADGSTFKNQGDCMQYVNTGK
jgi:hypothetical protein